MGLFPVIFTAILGTMHSYRHNFFRSWLPKEVHRSQQPVTNQNFAQQITAENYATLLGPFTHIPGRAVSFSIKALT